MNTIGYDATDEVDGNAPNGNFHGEFISLKNRKVLPPENPKRMASLKKSAVGFVEEFGGKKPFFMMVSHYAVHVPHAAREDLIEKYRKLPRGKYLDDSDYLPTEEISRGKKISHWRLQYAAMLEEVDEGLGAILDAVERTGQSDNTYIIFTSDNGGGLTPNGSLRGGKANLYEGGLRVPFVAAGPGVLSGVQCDVPVAQWDLLPTLHDLAKSEEALPEALDGGSLRSVFENGNGGKVQRGTEAFIFHYPCYFAPPLSVIRLGDYKLMEHLLTGEQKLFNVVDDYQERQNLVEQEPEVVARLKATMQEYLDAVEAEDVQQVYRARFAELDRFESRAVANFARIRQTVDDEKVIADAKKRLDADLARFAKNRKECRENMRGSEF